MPRRPHLWDFNMGAGIDYRDPKRFPAQYDLDKAPQDFTTMMHQFAQDDLGLSSWREVPKIHTVVHASVAALFADAEAMDWDERGPEHVDQIAAAINKGALFAPVVIGHYGAATKGLIDGRHRVHAARKLGLKKIPAIDLDAPAWARARRPGYDQFKP